MDFAAQINQ